MYSIGNNRLQSYSQEFKRPKLELPGFSLVIFTSRFEATRRLFLEGTRNFEPRSDDETTLEIAPPLQTSAPHQREDVWPDRFNVHQICSHGGSSVESGFEPGTLLPQGRDLTTRPPSSYSYLEISPIFPHKTAAYY
ncbi:hypothetical protein AVEN_84786-1 [Araneus ventricosus]|uniref:Uncharacterized protein n=1 Tax=Araneus ventricosus TaxID=182803 RepID=A0A4Y2MY25_ARAVE|nr:hypothetical protein AVEN_84786-1 [Araneus ventricosus]